MTEEELAKIINTAFRAGQLNAMETLRQLPPRTSYQDYVRTLYKRLVATPPSCCICNRRAVMQELCCLGCVTAAKNTHPDEYK